LVEILIGLAGGAWLGVFPVAGVGSEVVIFDDKRAARELIARKMQMPKISDPWDHHDWDSRSYVSQWAARQNGREMGRVEVFRLMAKLLPYGREAPSGFWT
jgi:hypothetical protein